MLLWCVIQITVGMLLGMLHLFRLEPIVIAEILCVGVGVLVICERRTWNTLVSHLQVKEWLPTDPFSRAMVAVMVGVCVLVTHGILIAPVTDYDSLAYHLPTMVHWYQTSSLDPWSDKISGRYPYAWEVLGTMFFFPMERDVFVAVPNLIAWLLLGTAVYVLVRDLHVTGRLALFGAALVMTVPQIVGNIGTLHVDLPFAAFAITACCFALRFVRRRSSTDLGLLTLALGGVLGTKVNALVYVSAFGCVLVANEIRVRWLTEIEERCPKKRFVLTDAVLLALCVVTVGIIGGYWYLRNWVDLGNPLGGLPVVIGGKVIMAGTVSLRDLAMTSLAYHFHPRDAGHWTMLIEQLMTHLGILVPVGVVCCAVLGWYTVRRSCLRERFTSLVLLIGISALAALYWYTPYTGSGGQGALAMTDWIGQAFRYGFPCIALMGAVAAIVVDRWEKYVCVPAVIVVMASACQAVCYERQLSSIVLLGLVTTAVYGVLVWWTCDAEFTHKQPWQRRLVAVACVIGVGLWMASAVVARWGGYRNVAIYGNVATYLDNVKEPVTVGYTYLNRPYPLFGRQWENTVVEARPYTQSRPKGKIDYIAIGMDFWDAETPLLLSRLQHDTNTFIRVAGGDPRNEVVLYKRL
jgi:hypothetical protein